MSLVSISKILVMSRLDLASHSKSQKNAVGGSLISKGKYVTSNFPMHGFPTNIVVTRITPTSTPLVVISDGGQNLGRYRLFQGFLFLTILTPVLALGQLITKCTLTILVGSTIKAIMWPLQFCQRGDFVVYLSLGIECMYGEEIIYWSCCTRLTGDPHNSKMLRSFIVH